MTISPSPCTIVQAFAVAGGRVRSVVSFDDDKIALCEAKLDAEGRRLDAIDAAAISPGKTLHNPITIPEGILFAERCVVGDPQAITHPKAIMVLATLVLAFVAAISAPEEFGAKGDDNDKSSTTGA